MASTVYVSNLSARACAFDLESLFEDHGTVRKALVLSNPQTGRSTCAGKVEMGTEAEAAAAILALDGAVLDGRAMRVTARAVAAAKVTAPPRVRSDRPVGRPPGRRPV